MDPVELLQTIIDAATQLQQMLAGGGQGGEMPAPALEDIMAQGGGQA